MDAVVVGDGELVNDVLHLPDGQVYVDVFAVEFADHKLLVVVDFGVVLGHDILEALQRQLLQDPFVVFVDIEHVALYRLLHLSHCLLGALEGVLLFLHALDQTSVQLLVLFVDFVDKGFEAVTQICEVL